MKIRLLVLLFAPLLAHAGKLPCDVPEQPGDVREAQCAIAATDRAQALSFKVLFAGGHDDTSASMTLKLDGQPMTCDPGSKTRLFAEDGNVFLECRFQLPAGKPHALGADVVWSHAQYTAIELHAEDLK